MKRINQLVILLAAIFPASCVYNDLAEEFSCENSNLTLALVSKVEPTSCKSINGKLVITATGGEPSYGFSLNGGVYQTNPEFTGLAPGTYEVIVKDFKGCKTALTVDLVSPDSNLNASIITNDDNQCLTDNGSISVTGQGGSGTYQYEIGSSGFTSNGNFSNLRNGTYVVIVKDSEDCQKVINVSVARGNTGISYANEIETILENNCNFSGCHGSGTGARDWTKFSNIESSAAKIKTRTGNKTMPIGGLKLTDQQISLIACWVDDGAKNN